MWHMTSWETGNAASPSGVIRLTPDAETVVYERDHFLIHGDNTEGNASRGCIIINGVNNRLLIWQDGDRELEVVP
jgi:hypothetical protein